MEHNFYPEKPELIEPKARGNMALTFFSVVVFILSFLLLFTDEVSFILNLVLVLIIHELGHFLMMKLFGYQNVRMLFIPLMGAFVQGTKKEFSQKQSLIVISAGPFPGIVLGIISLYLASVYKSDYLFELSILFLIINIINLVPLDPLDGGQLLKLLLNINHDLFIMIFTLFSSLSLIFIGWYLDSWFLIVFGFLMGFRVRSFQNQYELRKKIKEDEINYHASYDTLSNKDFAKIKSILLDNIPNLQNYLDMVEESEAKQMIASQVNNILVTPIKRDAALWLKILIVISWIASISFPIWVILNFDFVVANFHWWFNV